MLSMGMPTGGTASAVWTTPVPLNSNVNTHGSETFPCISADGKRLYFASFRAGGYYDDDIWYCEWDSILNDWGPAVNCGPGVNTDLSERSPAITPDNRRLYFSSWRDIGYGGWDIWYSDWDSTLDRFGTAVNAGSNVNTRCFELSVDISYDMQTLYVATGYQNDSAACSATMLKQCRWTASDSSWGPLQQINSIFTYYPSHESASLTQDGLHLFFSHQGPTGWPESCPRSGASDIYMCDWNGSQWVNYRSLCPPVNSLEHDRAPSISADGLTLYFEHRHPDSISGLNDDIYVSYYIGDTTYLDTVATPVLPAQVALEQNYPNPFNASTIIEFQIPRPGEVKLEIFNILGQLVAVLQNGPLSRGTHRFEWLGTGYASGAYFYLLSFDHQQVSKCMIYLR